MKVFQLIVQMNNFEDNHVEYRRQLQEIITHLKSGDTNIQPLVHDLEWSVKNDLNRLEVIGKDAFEDEVEELEKFQEVIDAIKTKYAMNFQVDTASFDDIQGDSDDEDLYLEEDADWSDDFDEEDLLNDESEEQ